MTSQQAAALLHAAGLTGPTQWIHFHKADGGEEAYTAAVVLLEAAGLVAETTIQEYANGEGRYFSTRFETENGALEITSPDGMPDTPAETLATASLTPCVCGDCCVSLTPEGRSVVYDLQSEGERAEFVSHMEARSWRDGDEHDEAAS